MNRRGFLGALLASGAVTAATVYGVPIPTPPTPPRPAGDGERKTVTLFRAAGHFDLVCYLGLGGAVTLPNTIAGDAVVVVKCRSTPEPWEVLDIPHSGDTITLPAHLNRKGETYVAYEFSRETIARHDLTDDIEQLRRGA